MTDRDIDAIEGFLARGGHITVCPTGTALHPFNASVTHQSLGNDASDDDMSWPDAD